MGYYVKLTGSNVVLKKENHGEILSRWHEMNSSKYDNIKIGGSYSGGKTLSKHYSWMPTDYDKTTSSPEEVLKNLGFDFEKNESEDIIIKSYDSKTGQEDLFFSKIADLIFPESVMNWRGEDEDIFVWSFDGEKMQILSGNTAVQKIIEMSKIELNTKKKKTRYNL